MVDLNIELRKGLNRFIILKVLLRTFERDKKHLNDLKMSEVFSYWYEMVIKELFEV